MKKEMLTLILGIFVISLVAANTATIVVMDNIGSFSGATLKVKSTDSSEFGSDKIVPSEYFSSVGMVKFDIETALSELDLQIRTTSNGQFVEEVTMYNVSINGSEVMVDLREAVEIEVITELVNESEEVVINETITEPVEVEVEVIEEIVEDEIDGSSFVEVTGNVAADVGSSIGKNKVYYFSGAGFLIVLFALFLVVKMAYRSGARAELKLLSKKSLDRRIDELDI